MKEIFFKDRKKAFDFLQKVRQSLAECGIDETSCRTVGVAVSGGADSVCLLVALSLVLETKLFAVNVNHNVRQPEESRSDSDFVSELCRDLGIPCVVYECPPGQIHELASREGKGIEDAARKVRYQYFDRFMGEYGIQFLAIAHNRNDQHETVLMRFLRGNSIGSLAGIQSTRDRFVRPLLGISRNEIEEFLDNCGIGFRTDSTNLENHMYRNKIRNILVPVLDSDFPGWKKGVEGFSRRARETGLFIQRQLESALERLSPEMGEKEISFDRQKFLLEDPFVCKEILLHLLKSLKTGQMVSGGFVEQVHARILENSCFNEVAGNVSAKADGKSIFLHINDAVATETGFSVIVYGEGIYELPCRSVKVSGKSGKVLVQVDGNSGVSLELSACFPLCIRSCQSGDRVLDESQSLRSLGDLMDSWKCGEHKEKIMVIQELQSPAQNIVGVLGSEFGYKDYVLR